MTGSTVVLSPSRRSMHFAIGGVTLCGQRAEDWLACPKASWAWAVGGGRSVLKTGDRYVDVQTCPTCKEQTPDA
jgi:hypothetical protein